MDAARKHGGRRHAGHPRSARAIWVTTVAAVATIAVAMVWVTGGSDPTTPRDDVVLGAGEVTPTETTGGSPSTPATTAAQTSTVPSPSATPTGTTTGSPPAPSPSSLPPRGSQGPTTSRPDDGPRPTRTARPSTRRPTAPTTRPSTRPTTRSSTRPVTPHTPTATGPVRPCRESCVLVRNWFSSGTEGWQAPSGGSLTRATGGANGPGSLHATGVTATSGPSLLVTDRRLSGPNRRWVSARIRVRVTDADGARLRLRVDGAKETRLYELDADGEWRILRAWFLPQGPVRLSVVAAPSRCTASPRVADLYLDDVLVRVLEVGEEPAGLVSPSRACW